MSTSEFEDAEAAERRFPRRFLFTAGAAAAAVGLGDALAPDAEAVAAKKAWVAGGNSGIKKNGTNFLGTKNVAPLIFKTAAKSGKPVEHMRIAPTGGVGIGTTAPTGALDVRGGGNKPTLHVVSNSAYASIAAILCSATKGAGLSASSTDGTGVIARSTNGAGIAASSVKGAGITAKSSKAAGIAATSTDSAAITATSTNGSGIEATGGSGSYGAYCRGGYAAVYGTAGQYGGVLYGTGSGTYGLYANGGYLGAYGTGETYGLYGSGATGVYGSGTTGMNGHGSSNGVFGSASVSSGKGVWGTGGQYGVYGNAGGTAGVRGDSGYVGVWAQATTYGLNAVSTDLTNQSFGVFAECPAANANAYALYSKGRAHVAGTLSKSAGSFKIDHPLDPENKWLSHSFVESPDMMNVYNGNVVLDHSGKATVELPDYFAALNAEFRYQLTTIGAHAPVYVSREVANNRFEIAGGTAGLKVSWQVTGIRQDDYAKHNPIEVETPKSKHEAGMREFVPAGSKARAMNLGPSAHGTPAAAPPDEALLVPNVRRPD